MSRVAPLETRKYPWYVRLIFWAQGRKYGKTLAPAYVWGRVPALMLGLQIYYRFLDRRGSLVDKALRSLVSARVSQLNECQFCFSLSSETLKALGISEEKLASLGDHGRSPFFTDRERAALRYAEAMSETGARVDDAVFAQLRPHFSEEQLVELTSWIAFQNLSSRFNAALDVPSQEFCLRKPG
ncbi:MAG: carboxymuconolactone decarboxylase family protein [Elusimicrobiota bacterium]